MMLRVVFNFALVLVLTLLLGVVLVFILILCSGGFVLVLMYADVC